MKNIIVTLWAWACDFFAAPKLNKKNRNMGTPTGDSQNEKKNSRIFIRQCYVAKRKTGWVLCSRGRKFFKTTPSEGGKSEVNKMNSSRSGNLKNSKIIIGYYLGSGLPIYSPHVGLPVKYKSLPSQKISAN